MLSNKKPLTRLVQYRDWLACGSPFPGGDAIKQKAADAAIFVIYKNQLNVNIGWSL